MKRTLIITICIVIACVLTVGGTFAFLADTSEDTNVFEMGNVSITLDEMDTDEAGVPIDGAERVTENEYKLIPGKTYVKDPTVTVKAGSEKAYIRMIVTVHNASAYLDITKGDHSVMFPELNGEITNVWTLEKETLNEEANTLTLEYRLGEKPAGTDDKGNDADKVLEPLFKSLIVPGEATSEQMKALNSESDPFIVEIVAHAVQAEGFENANAAWAAFEHQQSTKNMLTVTGETN